MLGKGKVASATSSTGKVEISRGAIATIVHQAVMESYGVVEMAPAGLRSSLARVLRQDDPRRGIAVEVNEEQVEVTLHVILEYGVRISEVVHNMQSSVKFAIEQALSMKVGAVNVYVQGLHFSDEGK
jgi:uncharacterized alkaline shock family protein YloU